MGYLRLRQVCLVSPALASAEEDFRSILGLEVCHRDPNLERYGLENILFPVGTSFIEVVSPIRPGTAAGRFLEQRGGLGGYMVILDCNDVDRRRRHVESMGIRVVNHLRYEDYEGVQLHPRGTGAAMVEFNQTVGGASIDGPYHPAGPHWQEAVRTDVTRRLVSVNIEAPDPLTFAQLWARMTERPAISSADDTHRISLDGGDILFTAGPSSAQAMFAGLTLEVADRAAVLQKASARGHPTDADSFMLCGIRIQLLEAN